MNHKLLKVYKIYTFSIENDKTMKYVVQEKMIKCNTEDLK